MSLSTSEPLVTLSTSSGLSPQALHDRHAARQRAVQGEHDVDRRPALRRLRRLSDLRRARQHDVPQPGDPICPSSCRETACRLKTRSLETSAEPKTLAHLQASGTEPIGQQASPEKPPPRNTGQKGALAKHRQRADAPRHLADPLSSKPVMPRKRNVSEVLNLCKGKVSQALAQRKHLKPARLEATSAARIRDKAMHRQQKPLAALVVNKAAAADDLAAHAKTQYHRGRARHPKAEALREQRVNHHDNSQDVDLQWEAPQEPEEVAEVDQPARCKGVQVSESAGAGHQQEARGAAHTCVSIVQSKPVDQAATQECHPSAGMPAVPPGRYAHHLKSFLLHRFCQASGLSEDEAQHPDALQRGVTTLVSALECGAKKSCPAASKAKKDMMCASTEAVRTFAALRKVVQHESAPSKLCPGKSKQAFKPAPPVRRQGRATGDPISCSPYPAGLQEERGGLAQGMGTSAHLWQQQGVDQIPLRGIQGVSLSLAGISPEPQMPNLGPDDCLGWMDSIHSSEPPLDRVHRKNDQDSVRSMPSASPEFWLTKDTDMANASRGAPTLGVLPSSSPQLEDTLQQYAVNSSREDFLDANDRIDADLELVCGDDIKAVPERDSFPNNLSKGAECQLDAGGRADAQKLRMHQDPRDAVAGLNGSDEAWLHDAGDLHDNSSDLISNFHVPLDNDVDEPCQRATYGKLHVRSNSRSRQGMWLEADPDPVAAFTGFCESLAM